MIKVYFDKNLLDSEIKSENFWAFDKTDNITYETFFKNKSNIIEYASIEKCEYIFLPQKWDLKINPHENKQKFSVCFFNDDFEKEIEVPKNIVLFRTSAHKTKIKFNEKIMPAFCEKISFSKMSDEHINKKTISFCGQVDSFRHSIFSEIQNNKSLNTNFIFRKGFWAPEIQDKKIARQQYFDNIKNSLFVLCMRGAGNFSYRLYETMASGRIPIIINSDLQLPFENLLNWKEFSVIIEKEEIKFLDLIIEYFLENKNIEELCYKNQTIWEEYLSPHGFIRNIKKEIEV